MMVLMWSSYAGFVRTQRRTTSLFPQSIVRPNEINFIDASYNTDLNWGENRSPFVNQFRKHAIRATFLDLPKATKD